MMEKDAHSIMPGTLSKEDIARLLSDKSTRAQMDVIEKLTEQYAAEGRDALSPEQMTIANDIFRLLMTRAEVTVRALLAMNLSQINKLPPDIVKQMANDVNEVASPVLQYSDVLSDEDLTIIINSMVDTEKLKAIAQRASVSENLADILVSTHIDPVVSTLVHNDGAHITEKTFEEIAQHHSESNEVMESLLDRTFVPVVIVEKVIARLSDAMRQNLEKKYGSLTDLKNMRKALDQSLSLTSLKMLGFKSSDQELVHLIQQLDANHTLSPFSALSMGNLQLFEVCLAQLLRTPLQNMQVLLQDPAGFKTVYDRAKLPENLFDAVVLAVQAIRALEQESIQSTGSKHIYKTSQVMDCMRRLAAGRKIKDVDRLYAIMQYGAH